MFPMHPNCRCSAYGHIKMDYKAGGSTLDREAPNGVWGGKTLEKEVDKVYNQSMRRNKNPDKRRPINIVRQNQLTAEFRKRGGKIWQDDESEAYLKLQGADAICFGADTIVLQKRPTVSEVLEEVFHADQHFRGEIDTNNPKSFLEAEIAAQRYLLSMSEFHKIPKVEIRQTEKALKIYLSELEGLENEK